jgi:hypothetical protein
MHSLELGFELSLVGDDVKKMVISEFLLLGPRLL